jgi:general L-amino acid transport system permease protein
MALATEAPKQSFRLGMLIYDTRYRAITIQVIVLVLVLVCVGWLLDNARVNLALKGKDIDFDFLWRRAGYDIEQNLIPYTNDSTHFRAVLVGLLNTLVVAFFGCVFATILGVFFGILRLSKNWIVSRLMTVYIEMFRNVPLLLWIVLVYVIFIEIMPQPKDFKPNADGVASAQMMLWDSVAITNRGTNLPAPLLTRPLPALDTAALSINTSFWFVLALIIGSIWVNRRIVRQATVVQEATGIRPTTWWKRILILFVPTIGALMLMGFHLEYPAIKGFNFQGGINVAHAFSALLLGLTLYYAAVIAETVRAGIQAISRGQTEAALPLACNRAAP